MCNSNDYRNRILIDWVAFTTDNDFELSEIISYDFDFVNMERGMLGYKSLSIESATQIKELRDGQQSMGKHYIISGESCRALEFIGFNLLKILADLKAIESINITRLDIAYDIFDDDKLLSLIVEAYNDGNYKSKLKSSNIIVSRSAEGRTGTTINFGSRQSSVMIRIYDKSAERDTSEAWVRIEAEIKDKKYSRKFIENINDVGLARTYKALINNYLSFIEYRDTNVSRSPVAKWWGKIIDTVDKIKLYEAPGIRNIDDVKNWLLEQTSASFATVLQQEQSRDFIEQMMKEGTRKMKNKHWNMIS